MGEYAHIHLNIKKESKILSNWNSNKEILVVYFYNNSNQDLLHTSWPCSCMSHGKESTCQYKRGKRCGFDPWVGKIPWKKKWQPSLVFLPGKSMDTGAWWAIAHGVTKSQHNWAHEQVVSGHQLLGYIMCIKALRILSQSSQLREENIMIPFFYRKWNKTKEEN